MQDIIDLLIKNAKLYKEADARLENACGENFDPIACTVYARRNILKGEMVNVNLPLEAHDAGFYLTEVTRLVGILIQQFNMNPDVVRNIWLPLLS